MKIKFKQIKNKPQWLLSIYGFLSFSIVIILLTMYFSMKSKEIIHNRVFDQLSAINKIKTHKLNLFFKYRKADAQALSSSLTIIELTKYLNMLDTKYDTDQLSKHEFIQIEDVTNIHKKYTEYVNQYLNNYTYTDALLVDNTHGHILFSANYKQYIGKNLNSKEFSKSDMAKLYKKVLNKKTTQISDMHKPFLYSDIPVMLVATPVLENGKILAILILKLPSTAINEVLHFKGSDEKTCKTYAVGEDKLLRSDSTLMKLHTVTNGFKNPQLYRIINTNVSKALNGEDGANIIKDYRGASVFSVYKSYKINSFHWAIMTEVDEKEINAELLNVEKNMYLFSLFLALSIFFIGYFIIQQVISKYVLNPLSILYDKAKGFEDIINNSLNEIYIFNKEKLHFVFANYTALNNSGYTLEELQKMKAYSLKPKFDEVRFLQFIQPLIDKKEKFLFFETVHKRKDGTFYDVQINLELMEIDGIEKFVAIINDITEHKKTAREKEHYFKLASYDHLTKIFNRQMFDQLFDKEIERSTRYGYLLSIVLLDIDHFKKVNDTFGHQAGDDVLVSLAQHIQKSLRTSDIFARWGGEEFVILFPHTDINIAVKKSEQLRVSIEKLQIDGVDSITCSFGVVQVNNLESENKIFKQVDDALYKAKENGRNRVETIEISKNKIL